MTIGDWRAVRDLELTDDLIPDPNAQHIKLRRLANVRVAIEGAFLHIDARPEEAWRTAGEFTVYTVPASAVRVMNRQETKKSSKMVVHG